MEFKMTMKFKKGPNQVVIKKDYSELNYFIETCIKNNVKFKIETI